jgi:alkanesulfonate monooxygenase SsuD/methylene tetrahydromethanopterin reductase-like flavin-dependent oxidoreductase (luciferase family)
MAFEFGMFHEFQRRQGQTEAEAFTQSFAQVDAAERWGLDAVWLAEIHMAPERSVLSAPLNIASAIAARTRNIKIGLAVQVLPLCQPLRLAERSRNDRPHQPGPADLRRRTERLSARLRGLRRPLR